jgi:3,4-dihydroxy 2-butanone 4-phosphate synthase/GTP cyclohydrolase II
MKEYNMFLYKQIHLMGREFNTIKEAIEDIKQGKVIIVLDDEDRENEGDFVTAARNATPEVINFMATHGRGLICIPLSEAHCSKLELSAMVHKNNSAHETNFTVSVDLIGKGCTTGISVFDRSKTIAALIDPKTQPSELGRPGHIFPLKGVDGGVLKRPGHTEAAIDLSRMAGFEEAGVIVEIMKEDGEMARLPDLFEIAKRFDLKIITIKDLIAYRLRTESLILKDVTVNLPTKWGDFKLTAFTQRTTGEHHLALVKGDVTTSEPVLVRMHSSCITGDIFGSCRCDCGEQLQKSFELIEEAGKGVVVYLNQEGRGIGLINKLYAYNIQERGFDTVEANLKLGFKADERDYRIGSEILRSLRVKNILLLTNNPEKRKSLLTYGFTIIETIPLEINSNPDNERYLQTKRDRMGHGTLKELILAR